ncbi:MAG: hypothetical protein DRH79_05425 [Candidatus Cloacimonadota bacterium]|nr:MAG: hypothetical protein DRH79_05425 [Candidatus Cloacimonadota bacterium]
MKIKFILFFVLISVNSWLQSVTWHIKQDGTGDFTTIQEGINASTNSDTVLVHPGTYYENLNMNEKNIVFASLELITGDPQYISTTIIDGQRLLSCIDIQNITIGATIQGFTIRNGYGTFYNTSAGGGILSQTVENTFIVNCWFTDNVATLGGAICSVQSNLTFSGLRIVHNSAGYGGAISIYYNNTITFDNLNLCSIYNNNAGKGADLYIKETGHINVIVDTFSVFNPDNYFAEYLDGSTYTFNIQHNWMELIPHDMYVASNGDDNNSGLNSQEPLRNISWAVRRIYADEQNPCTVYVAEGTYSWEENQQVYPIGCKEYVSIIGEDMNSTFLYNDFSRVTLIGKNLNSTIEIKNFTIQNDPERYTAGLIGFSYVELVKLSNINISNNSNLERILSSTFINNHFENLIVSNNITNGTNSGLGLHNNAGYMKNCIIANNENTQQSIGPEVAMQLAAGGDFLIENCKFSGNHSTSSEGRIIRTTNCNGNEPSISFNNCLIADNSIGSNYICQNFNYDGLTEFNNCTIVNNTASGGFYSSALYNYGDVNITNTIMCNNTQYEVMMVDDTSNGYVYELNVDQSNIQDGEAGIYNMNNANIINWNEGNIDEDSLFLLSGDNPYQLAEFSPCIDAGTTDTTGLFLPPWDILHHDRIWDGDENGTAIIDMGCYEFGAPSIVSVEDPVVIIEDEISLTNYPNPFNPDTTISFNLPVSGKINLIIYNIKGQKVKTLMDCFTSAGMFRLIWNGKNDNRKSVASGEYIAILKVNNKEMTTRKMMLMK